MSSCRRQGLIEAPVQIVWDLVGNRLDTVVGRRRYRQLVESSFAQLAEVASRERSVR